MGREIGISKQNARSKLLKATLLVFLGKKELFSNSCCSVIRNRRCNPS
jgi:hypothetical protein